MNITKRHVLSVVAAVAATAALTGAIAGAGPFRARGAGELRDLDLAFEQPFDHATAQVVAVENGTSTTVTLKVQGIDHAAAGNTYGAHVHTGSCAIGNGLAAGPHYKHGLPTDQATAINEVWLDFTVAANGTGTRTATVPFVIPASGAASVVIHQLATNPATPNGAAGLRWACIPVEF